MASITKRGNSYRIRVFIGKSEDGKQISKSATFKIPDGMSEKRAEREAREFALIFEKECYGLVQYDRNMLFSELSEWYFDNYAPVNLGLSTQVRYREVYEKHLKPAFGMYRLKDINPPLISKKLSELTISPQTIKKVYCEMQSICKRAVEQGIIENTPCHNVVLPKTEQKYKTCTFSIEDVKEFIQIIDNSRAKSDFKRIIKILLFTGMRIGELLALEWDDIDFVERTISISHTLLIIKGEFIRSATKTVKSTRVITMNNTVYNLLIEQLKYTEELKKALGQKCMHPDAVFISDKGNYKNRNLIGATLKIVTAKTRFKDVTPH